MATLNTKYLILNTGFSRSETLGVVAILAAILFFSLRSLEVSKIRARDEQRKNNATNLVHALERYHDDFGVFPPSSSDGKLIACGTPEQVVKCEWGGSNFVDLRNPSVVYGPIPIDPSQGQGISLFYISDGSNFQILTHLEFASDPAMSSTIASWGLDCGTLRCNYGVTGSLRPVTKLLK